MSSDGVLGLPAFSEREALANFIEAMKVAESAAKQLAFYMQSPAWLQVENLLAGVRDTSVKLAQVQVKRSIILG